MNRISTLGGLVVGVFLGAGGMYLGLSTEPAPAELEESAEPKSGKSERKKSKAVAKRGSKIAPQFAAGEFSRLLGEGAAWEDYSKYMEGAVKWSADEAVAQAWEIADPTQRRQALQRLFRYWIGNDREAAMSALDEMDNVVMKRELYRDALRWLADADPKATLALLQEKSNPRDQELWSRSFLAWARKDREEAVAAVLKIENKGIRERSLGSIAEHLAEVDLKKALKWAGELEGEAAGIALAEVLEEGTNSDPKLVAENVEKIKDRKTRLKLIHEIGEEWGERDPDAALEWAKDLDEGKETAIGEIAESVLRVDADRAQEILDLIPDSSQRDDVMQQIARARAVADVEQAIEWLSSLPAEDRSTAWSGVAREWAQTDPEAAALYAANSDDPAVRDQLVAAASYVWGQRDPAEAAAWAQGLEGKAQSSAMYRIVESWSRDDPAQAGDFVTSSLNGELRDTMTQRVVSRWMRSDAVEACAWVDQIPRGEVRDSAVRALVGSIGQEFPETALQWAHTIHDGERRENMVRKLERSAEHERIKVQKKPWKGKDKNSP